MQCCRSCVHCPPCTRLVLDDVYITNNDYKQSVAGEAVTFTF